MSIHQVASAFGFLVVGGAAALLLVLLEGGVKCAKRGKFKQGPDQESAGKPKWEATKRTKRKKFML